MPTIAAVVMSCLPDEHVGVKNDIYLSLSILIGVIFGAIIHAWRFICGVNRDVKAMFTYGVTYAYLSLIWLMVAGMAALSYMALSGLGENVITDLYFWLWMLWCLACNMGMSRPENARIGALLGACVVSIVVLIIFTNNGMAIPKAVMRALGLGELPVALVVTKAGCQHLNQASGQVVCKIQPHEKSALVCPVMLRSRIGSPYFIGLSPYTAQGAWPADALPARTATVALLKSEVLGWSRIEPKLAENKACDSAPPSAKTSTAQQAVVTHLCADEKIAWMQAQCDLSK